MGLSVLGTRVLYQAAFAMPTPWLALRHGAATQTPSSTTVSAQLARVANASTAPKLLWHAHTPACCLSESPGTAGGQYDCLGGR